jgi:hypothetical protein
MRQILPSAKRQNLRLAHREIDVDRVGLDDGCERGRSRYANQRAEIDQMIGYTPSKGARTLV